MKFKNFSKNKPELLKIDIGEFLKRKEKWLKHLKRTASIKIGKNVIIIRGVKGIQYTTKIPRTFSIDIGLAHFLGLLLGDSCSSKQTSARLGLANINKTLIKEAHKQMRKNFFYNENKVNLLIKYKKKLSEKKIKEISNTFGFSLSNIKQVIDRKCPNTSFEVFIHNRPLKRIIFEEIIPDAPKVFNQRLLTAFFAGVLDADGNVRKDYLAITVGHQKELKIVIETIKKLFNIDPHLIPRKNANAYDIRITGVNTVSKVIKGILPFFKTNKGDIFAKGHRQLVL